MTIEINHFGICNPGGPARAKAGARGRKFVLFPATRTEGWKERHGRGVNNKLIALKEADNHGKRTQKPD